CTPKIFVPPWTLSRMAASVACSTTRTTSRSSPSVWPSTASTTTTGSCCGLDSCRTSSASTRTTASAPPKRVSLRSTTASLVHPQYTRPSPCPFPTEEPSEDVDIFDGH
ncbi:unnamed protein product, partial [Ixodes pacificus]